MSVNRRYILVLLAGFVCHAAVVPFISWGPVKPDIVLIIVAAAGFIEGSGPGAVGGFFGGFLQDLVAAGSLGLEAAAKTVVGYISGQAERTLLGNSLLMPVAGIAGVSFLSQMIYMVLAFVIGENMEFTPALKTVVIPSTVYTAAVGVVLFPYISRFLSAEKQEKVFK